MPVIGLEPVISEAFTKDRGSFFSARSGNVTACCFYAVRLHLLFRAMHSTQPGNPFGALHILQGHGTYVQPWKNISFSLFKTTPSYIYAVPL